MKLLKKLGVPGGAAGALIVACGVCRAPPVVPLAATLAALGTVGLE
jgi:hypothetical protein